MKNRYFIYGFILLATLVASGCDKESNVVAPSDSTVSLIAIPTKAIAGGDPVRVIATVTSDSGPMNGVAVRFTSSSPDIANFGGGLSSGTADTKDSGVAEVLLFGIKAGSAEIIADLPNGVSSSVTITVE